MREGGDCRWMETCGHGQNLVSRFALNGIFPSNLWFHVYLAYHHGHRDGFLVSIAVALPARTDFTNTILS